LLPPHALSDAEKDQVLAEATLITGHTPADVTAGAGFGLVVTAEDAGGHVVTSFAGAVTVALRDDPGGAALGGALTVTASAGVATFSGLTLDRAGVGYTLQITGGGLTPATSSALNVTAPPAATSQAATAITITTATLNGSVNPGGVATTASFIYGTDPDLASGTTLTAGQAIGSGTDPVWIVAPLSGLVPGTTYYFRVVATNSDGTTDGAILTFTANTSPIDEYSVPAPSSYPNVIAAGPDGNLWFGDGEAGKVGIADPTSHSVTEVADVGKSATGLLTPAWPTEQKAGSGRTYRYETRRNR
jgi:hypothetical protein